jgi:hypothetical protein
MSMSNARVTDSRQTIITMDAGHITIDNGEGQFTWDFPVWVSRCPCVESEPDRFVLPEVLKTLSLGEGKLEAEPMFVYGRISALSGEEWFDSTADKFLQQPVGNLWDMTFDFDDVINTLVYSARILDLLF